MLGKKAEEGADRGRDGWMASLTWVWANSRRWWRTGKPGVLQSMGLKRVGHDWATEQQKTGIRLKPLPMLILEEAQYMKTQDTASDSWCTCQRNYNSKPRLLYLLMHKKALKSLTSHIWVCFFFNLFGCARSLVVACELLVVPREPVPDQWWTWPPCIGSRESQPLDHQGTPWLSLTNNSLLEFRLPALCCKTPIQPGSHPCLPEQFSEGYLRGGLSALKSPKFPPNRTLNF